MWPYSAAILKDRVDVVGLSPRLECFNADPAKPMKKQDSRNKAPQVVRAVKCRNTADEAAQNTETQTEPSSEATAQASAGH
jgi:hypothetical protein